MKSPLLLLAMNYLRSSLLCGTTALALTVSRSPAAVTLEPLASFSGGWLAPLEVSWLSDTGATERSIAYSASENRVYVASRNGGNYIRILDADTAAELGGDGVSMGGVSGGFFAISGVGVSGDGVLYGCNLRLSAATPFKIYQWTDTGSDPVTVFDSSSPTVTGFSEARIGDTFDVTGSGASTLLIAGESNGGTTPGPRNGYAVFAPPAAGTEFTGSMVLFSGTNPAAGDFKIGMTFTNPDTVLGAQGTGGTKFTRYSGTTGTFDHARVLTTTSERPMDYLVLGGRPLLATIETNGNTTTPAATYSSVRIYDLTTPTAPAIAASGKTATSYFAQGVSGPGSGSVQWGKVTGDSATLYALSTNNGIQAFTVTVTPEATPPSIATHPVSKSFFERGVATFTCTATGTPPLTYQWLKDDAEIPLATASTYSFRPVTSGSGGSYRCRVTGTVNPPALSDPAVLTVVPSVNTTALTELWPPLLPGSRAYLSENDVQRGLGYNPTTEKLYLVNRAPGPQIHILSAADGADSGSMNMTDVTGGFFAINMVGVAGDGFIYACNLSTSGTDFKIYQWPDDFAATPPAAVYSGNPIDPGNPIGARIGDSFTVRGSGTGTQCAAGTNLTNQFVIFRPDPDQAGFFQAITVTVTDAANGAFSLGIAFGEGNTVWGKSNGGGLTLASFELDTSVNPPTVTSTAVLATYGASTIPVSGGAIAVDPVNGCLAHIQVGDSDNVRLYRLPVPFPTPAPASLELLDQEFFHTDNPNGNAVGTVVFGGNKLFALNTNNGLAAFTVVKPPPASAPPVITDITQNAGNVVFKLRGTVGKTYLIEKSPDLTPLATWASDGTVTQNSIEETVTRAIPAATPRLYWRAREQTGQVGQ